MRMEGKMPVILVCTAVFLMGTRCVPDQTNTNVSVSNQPGQGSNQGTKIGQETWEYGGMAIQGNFADAEVVTLPDGTLRMYYSIEPEVPGNQLEMYSAVSSDGVNWEQESGTRMTFNTFPDVVLLNSGDIRIYTQNSQEIHSAVSTDGLNFTAEEGVRVPIDETNPFEVTGVAASTTTQLSDGSYVMVYRGNFLGAYSSEVPNQNGMSVLLWATSTDGLSFAQQGLAVDSRNETFQGLLDGPEWVMMEDNSLRLYFWSYGGVYYVTFENGTFSEPTFAYTTATHSNVMYPENPPGDPTLAYINNTWFMYYGVHEQGIAYARLRE